MTVQTRIQAADLKKDQVDIRLAQPTLVLTPSQCRDPAMERTNLWLARLENQLYFTDREQAYSGLRAVLQALRDHMSCRQAKQFAARLPTPLRMVFFEGWHISRGPGPAAHREAFLEHVAEKLPFNFPSDPLILTKAVFALVWSELDHGETAKVVATLTASLHGLWPEEAWLARPA